jgi:hypothetical protein
VPIEDPEFLPRMAKPLAGEMSLSARAKETKAGQS